MKAHKTLLIGAVAAMFTAGASGAYMSGIVPLDANTIVTAMKADERCSAKPCHCNEGG